MDAREKQLVSWFQDITLDDVARVGGKNASLGEMIGKLKENNIAVPDGFATTAEAYWLFLEHNNLEQTLRDILQKLEQERLVLAEAGEQIRRLFYKSTFPPALKDQILEAYSELGERYKQKNVDVAVRSSATAEDLPGASFAGQQETFLNVRGEKEVIDSCRKCLASLFTDRAISYRKEKGFEHMKVALSIGIQKMVRADRGGSGVMFSIDTESGFPDVVLINAGWGLGENIVKGTINPDQYQVFKLLLHDKRLSPIIDKRLGDKEKKMIYASGGSSQTVNIDTSVTEREKYVLEDAEILTLARWAVIIEEHYGQPMDMEWARDGKTGELFILQARPETVQSLRDSEVFETYQLTGEGELLISGLSIGSKVVQGTVRLVEDVHDLDKLNAGDILVTEMTEPDWVPAMRTIGGIITDFGGRTCHAAIVSRELGVPAVVGTGEATEQLKEGQQVTLSCAEGEEGHIYAGQVDFAVDRVNLQELPKVKTSLMINLATPEGAFKWWRLPVQGIGLARMEFIISQHIRIHPMALVHYEKVKGEKTRRLIRRLTRGYADKRRYFVEKLARGIAKIASVAYPDPAIVRMSDFKTNEYANLIGGELFEPHEENPMIGWRGASRYYSEGYREGFALECQAIKMARQDMGLHNIIVMIPFCRTPNEADRVLEVMASEGLKRGEDRLQVYMMCEIPSNVILAEEFAERFDGFSIGSNDLTQLTLGVDRDSSRLAYLFDEHNDAVRQSIDGFIDRVHKSNSKVGFCGQAPSDDPEYAAFLVEAGIDSISLNPDSVVEVIRHMEKIENRQPIGS